MNLKARLMTAISMFALVFCVLIVGVWALKTTDFSVGGSINFYAKGIQATISKGALSSTGSWKTPSDATTKMPEVKINTSKTQDQLDAEFAHWTGLSLLFNESGDDVTITFSITNDASYTDKALAVNVTTTSTLENATLAINTNSAKINSGKSQEFVITFHVTEKTANAKISAFSINFDLQLVDLVVTDESQVSYLTFSYDHDNLTASVTKCASGTATAEIPERVRHTYTNDNSQQVTAVYTVTSITDGASTSTGAFYATRSALTSVSLPSTLEKIGTYSFYYCSKLTGITIPDSVTSIGDNAFNSCTKLTGITIPDSVTSIGEWAFSYCSGLTNVTIGNRVTSIGERAFNSCTKLTSITIPESVASIEYNVFSGCSGLETIEVDDNNQTYNDGNGNNCIIEKISNTLIAGCKNTEIPNTVTAIGSTAFDGCAGLTSITIPNSVESIGFNAFSYCSGLTNVTIGRGVTSIGNLAFSGCSKLTEVNYLGDINSWAQIEFSGGTSNPIDYSNSLKINGVEVTNAVIDSATTINAIAFYNCTKLTSVTIGNQVTSIGDSAFSGCSGLTSVTIGSGVTNIGDQAFYHCSKNLETIEIDDNNTTYNDRNGSNCLIDSSNTLILGCKNTVIPNTVKVIDNEAFWYCSGLTSIIIPDSVETIGNYAFLNCGLTSVTIGNGVTRIGRDAFGGCDELVCTAYGNAKYLGNSSNQYLALIQATSTSITNCTINPNCKLIAGGAFYECEELSKITIPGNVKYIGDHAFYYSYSLSEVTISNGVKIIGDTAFGECENLTSITIPDSVTHIGSSAFGDCIGLSSVTIGSGVTSIEGYAFGNCGSLETVIMKGATPPILMSNTFFYTYPSVIYVPNATAQTAYQTAQYWSDFSDIIDVGP